VSKKTPQAIHEAAHAVVAHYLGSRVARLSEEGCELSGEGPASPKTFADAHKAASIALAGAMAEGRFTSEGQPAFTPESEPSRPYLEILQLARDGRRLASRITARMLRVCRKADRRAG
jgi:hypothetical protein